MQTIEVEPGNHISHVAHKAVEAAAFTGEDATFIFNDTPMIVHPDMTVDQVVRLYQMSRGDDPDDHGTFVVTL